KRSTMELKCLICLDLFTDPVSTPCGHNFCKSCLNQCWNNSQTYRCPFCKAHFKKRPDLKINTALRPVLELFREKSGLSKSEVLCDFCDDIKKKTDVQQMIQDRMKRIQDIRHLAKLSKVSRCQSELLEMMEQKQKAAEKQAEELIKELEQEITELKRRDTELEQLSHTEDHLLAFQAWIRVARDWSTTIREEVLFLWGCLFFICWFSIIALLFISYLSLLVDVTLDPDTAYPNLVLSDDGKQVTSKDIKHKLPNNPERFDYCPCVLAHEGFSSGRFYFEVQVKGMTDWDLGVARESINRKGIITAIPEAGYWIVVLRNGNNYLAGESSPVPLSLRVKPQVVGVFVDYEEGLVSFYDVESRSHIFSFTSQSFTEKLFPFFSPCKNEKGKIAAPLIISHASCNICTIQYTM
uniref:Bloodthirsty-related gene family, member 21 n=1 Tax=Sinocyclocheilus grahami TaxID=75366 RepID=A0A672RAA6_SINGR